MNSNMNIKLFQTTNTSMSKSTSYSGEELSYFGEEGAYSISGGESVNR